MNAPADRPPDRRADHRTRLLVWLRLHPEHLLMREQIRAAGLLEVATALVAEGRAEWCPHPRVEDEQGRPVPAVRLTELGRTD